MAVPVNMGLSLYLTKVVFLPLIVYSAAALFLQHAENSVCCLRSLHLVFPPPTMLLCLSIWPSVSSSSLSPDATFLMRLSLTSLKQKQLSFPHLYFLPLLCLLNCVFIQNFYLSNIICPLFVCLLSVSCTQMKTVKFQGFGSVVLTSILSDPNWLLGTTVY